MPAISTRDEALAAVGAALAQWTAASGDVLARATAAVRGARAETEAELSRRARRVAELASLLGSLRADDPRRAAVAYDLARAQADQHAAVQAATRVTGLMERAAALQRSHARNTRSFTEAARADLTRREGQLGAYRAAGAGGLGGGFGGGFAGTPHALGGLALGGAAVGGAVTGGSAVGGAGAAGGGTAGPGWLTSAGLADVSVAEAGFADNPIVGEFGRDGLTRADYRWAVTQWDEVIRPGLDRGMTRDDFAAKDAARDAPPLRRLAFVYDIFLGSETIVVNRLPDGTIDVTNGRHRLTVARELGVTSLPARWVR
jgi:hypothetical protein